MWQEKIRVLAVENNKELCEILEALVKNEDDMEWAGAVHDGIEAVETIPKAVPDVIILDIIMPYLDGLEVLAKLNEMNLPKKPKVIVLTAFEEEGMVRKSAKLGADYYLLKPFDRESLINRIRQVAGPEVTPLYTRRERPRPEPARTLEDSVTRLLYRMGVPTYFKGYLYLREAITMVTRDIALLGAVTKALYPRIAEKFGTTPLIVEAAIRYTIQKTWKQGNQEYINKVFGYAVNLRGGKPPTNSFFIARLAEELRLGMVEEA